MRFNRRSCGALVRLWDQIQDAFTFLSGLEAEWKDVQSILAITNSIIHKIVSRIEVH